MFGLWFFIVVYSNGVLTTEYEPNKDCTSLLISGPLGSDYKTGKPQPVLKPITNWITSNNENQQLQYNTGKTINSVQN